jgi:hypothetical protein
MNDRFVLTGNLSEIRLPTLLLSLYKERETGRLYIVDGSITKTLFVKEGQVVYATSTNPDDRLGECLLRRGTITIQQYLDSAYQIHFGRRQGEILVDMGALGPEDLVESLSQQLYDIIFSMFEMQTGTYTLELESFSTLEFVTLSMDIPVIILRGMERLTSWAPMFAVVGEPSIRVRGVREMPSFLAGLDLDPDQEHVLELCRSGMAISSVLDASYLSQFQTYRLIWIFMTLGLIERQHSDRGSGEYEDNPESLLEQYNDLYGYIHHHLEREGADPGALAEVLEFAAQSCIELSTGQEDLISYGRLDVDVALCSLRELPESERLDRLRAFLEEVLYAMVFAADRILPEERRSAVREYILKRSNASIGGE